MERPGRTDQETRWIVDTLVDIDADPHEYKSETAGRSYIGHHVRHDGDKIRLDLLYKTGRCTLKTTR